MNREIIQKKYLAFCEEVGVYPARDSFINWLTAWTIRSQQTGEPIGGYTNLGNKLCNKPNNKLSHKD